MKKNQPQPPTVAPQNHVFSFLAQKTGWSLSSSNNYKATNGSTKEGLMEPQLQKDVFNKPPPNGLSSSVRDDPSVTSALTVGECSSTDEEPQVIAEQEQHQQQGKKHAAASGLIRHVRFNLKNNLFYPNLLMFEDECVELWHSPSDQQTFRNNALRVCKTVAKVDQSAAGQTFTSVISLLHQACCQVHNIGTADSVPSILTRKEERLLRDLFGNSHAGLPCIGLERHIVRIVAKDKQERRKLLVQAIYRHENQLQQQEQQQHRLQQLQQQQEAIVQGARPNTSAAGSAESLVLRTMTGNARTTHKSAYKVDAAEGLSLTCQQITLASRLFARHLAQAQAASI